MRSMLRTIAVALSILGLAACGRYPAAATASEAPSANGATLGAYVLDATPASPAPGGTVPGGGAVPSGGTAGGVPASACSQGQDAYKVLVFLVSSDTRTSVSTIVSDLRGGQSLADVAGGKTGLVEGQATDLVQAWLQYAEANGKVTADQAAWYRTVAQGVISGLMTANVASCIPNGG
jgi:hypothetical protein